MPPQLKRLVPLFIAFIGLFLLARYFLIPDSFGEFGHYRGNSLKDNADKILHYAGTEACIECHDDVAADKASDAHNSLACESCHGPALGHVESFETVDVSISDKREHCGLCHSINPARNEVIVQVDLAQHYPEKKCIECHNPHKPWDLKDQDNPGETL